MKELGVYIHIPFCKKKCYYCDFVSFSGKQEMEEIYVKCLIKEIKNFFYQYKNVKISTIYIGGGTPSFIESRYINEILSVIDRENVIESTIEVNPGTVNRRKLQSYKDSGINRVSIGLQSTEDFILEQIGRIHNFKDFLLTYRLVKEIGFKNINIDLMIGLPHQNISIIKKTLEEILKLDPSHISVYSLIIEEDTKIEKMIENKVFILPSENEERNMYWYVKNFLELNGYNHYEISNFAKKGFESKHNLNCWEQKEYVGFGVAAHSYIDNVRYSNTNILEEYIKNCETDNFLENKIVHEKQDDLLKEKEYMLIGLRKIEGISIQNFKTKFGQNPVFIFKEELNRLTKQRLLQIDLDRIKLTNKGLDLANIVWEEFI